jgi:hypothetical protein
VRQAEIDRMKQELESLPVPSGFSESHHKTMLDRAEDYYSIARDLESEAAALMDKAEFLGRRGDAICEAAMAYRRDGKVR